MHRLVSIVWSFKRADALEVRELKKQRKCSAVVTFPCKSQHLSAGSNDGFQMAHDGFPWVGGAGGAKGVGGSRGCMCESFKCVHMWVKERAEEDVEKANICSLACSLSEGHASICVRRCRRLCTCLCAQGGMCFRPPDRFLS